eukprot:2868271-Amphidinium_carterae.1
MPEHDDSVTDRWPLLTDFGALQSFQSFKPGEAVSLSECTRTSAWKRAYAASEVHTHSGRQQNVRRDMYAWALTLARVASAPVVEQLRNLLMQDRLAAIAAWTSQQSATRLESPSNVASATH